MVKPLLSIIIPVYNNSHAEISRCFNSIKEQKCNDYEVIVVDDGSSESCALFLDEITMKLNRFRVIHQKNQGVSMARNNGVKEAAGQYIAFIDADDMITKNYFWDAERILQNEKAANIDVIYGYTRYEVAPQGYYENFDRDLAFTFLDEFQKSLLVGYLFDGKNNFFRRGNFYINRGPAAKVVKRDLALDIPFDIRLNYGEDLIWNLEILKKSNKLIYVNKFWYIYIENKLSATHLYNPLKKDWYIEFLTKLWKYVIADSLKVQFLGRCLQLICEVEKSYYFYNVNQIFQKPDLSQIVCNQVWSSTFCFKYAIHLDKKDLVKYILLKIKCLGFYFWLYKKIKIISWNKISNK